MASIHHPQASVLYHHSRKSYLKSARSAPVTKTTFKSSKHKYSKSEEDFVFENIEDDDMASSFLQYCAMCENQIVIPNSSVLYCSESCRRKDAHIHDTNPEISLFGSHPSLPTFELGNNFTTRTILPCKLPTPRPLDARIPPVFHNGKSDLDPTEWKPADKGGATGISSGEKANSWKPKLIHRPSAEAYGYLAQFHRSAPAATARPLRSMPSLSHTPTTTGSSGTSLASTPSESGDSNNDTSLISSAMVKDAELSSPTLTAVSDVKLGSLKSNGAASTLVGGLSYKKKSVFDTKGTAAGSLKRLLGNETLTTTTALAM